VPEMLVVAVPISASVSEIYPAPTLANDGLDVVPMLCGKERVIAPVEAL